MAVVYKITSPSKRVYIGSAKNFDNRIRHYKRMTCKSQPKLYNSFLKYGYDNATQTKWELKYFHRMLGGLKKNNSPFIYA